MYLLMGLKNACWLTESENPHQMRICYILSESTLFLFQACLSEYLGSLQQFHCNVYDVSKHYKNSPIQIYRKFHLQKLKIFRWKNLMIFTFLLKTWIVGTR